MTLNWKTTYFPVLGVNISQSVRTAVARLPLRQLGFLAIFVIMLSLSAVSTSQINVILEVYVSLSFYCLIFCMDLDWLFRGRAYLSA